VTKLFREPDGAEGWRIEHEVDTLVVVRKQPDAAAPPVA
jgi:hypothetical protein